MVTFRVGMKVVCVDDSFAADGERVVTADGERRISTGNTGGLTKGTVYTVAAIYVGSYDTVLLTRELRRRGPSDKGFSASRFRPVVEKKPDISVFEEILRRESIDAPELVP